MRHQELVTKIENASTTAELETIVESIPLQKNGHRTAMARHLDDTFWYINLDNVQKQKDNLLRILKSY